MFIAARKLCACAGASFRSTAPPGDGRLRRPRRRTTPSEIQRRIEEALVRSAETDAERIRVEVDGDKVILTDADGIVQYGIKGPLNRRVVSVRP